MNVYFNLNLLINRANKPPEIVGEYSGGGSGGGDSSSIISSNLVETCCSSSDKG